MVLQNGNNQYDVTKEGATKGTMKFYQGKVGGLGFRVYDMKGPLLGF